MCLTMLFQEVEEEYMDDEEEENLNLSTRALARG